jgi:hypothetical protein
MLTVARSAPSAEQRDRGFRLPFGPDRPLMYVHIPKCGGTSVNVLLGRIFPAEQGVRLLEHHPRRLANNTAGLGWHPCYCGHVVYRFRDLLPARTAVITFLRDPVDRAISAFYFFRSLGRAKLAEEQTTPGLDRCCELSLDEFLEAEPLAARVNLGNIQTWMFSQPEMYHVSRWRPLTRADLDEARRNLERVAFVGVSDRFEESIRLLCRMCDWPLPDTVPHENRTPVRPAKEEVSPKARAALEELTTLDADLYRLGTDLFADALRDVPLPHVPPAPSRIDLTFEGPIPGSGWFDREPRPGGYFCWTGRAAWLEVRLAGSGELALAVEVQGAVDPAQIDGLTASVNGRPVPMFRSQVGAVHRFLGRAPTEPVANGRYRVEFRVPRTVRPCDVMPGSTDNRELGVAVSRVELELAGFAS